MPNPWTANARPAQALIQPSSGCTLLGMSYSLIGIVERALVKVAQQPHVSLRQLAHFLEIDRGTLAAALQEAHLDLRALKRNWLLQAAVSSLRGGGIYQAGGFSSGIHQCFFIFALLPSLLRADAEGSPAHDTIRFPAFSQLSGWRY